MSFGVDTDSFLDTEIDWSAYYAWKPQYPTFAGRYFAGETNPPNATEFTTAKTQTSEVLSYIFPIFGALSTNDGTYDQGASAAQTICGEVDTFRASDQLSLPANNRCIIYVDWDPGYPVSAAWWAGFANAVTNFGTEKPYHPGLYCPYFEDSSNLYVPELAVQEMFTSAASDYASDDIQCYGLFAAQPEDCDWCAEDGYPSDDFKEFGSYDQPLGGSKTAAVPTLIHQYAEPTECGDCGYTNFAGGQSLDMDSTDSSGALDYMMVIG